eukprot:194586-Chlamydomonas_euryale.AAC.3
MSEAHETPCRAEDVHELEHPCRRVHLSCWVEGAIWPPANASDPAETGLLWALARGCSCRSIRSLVFERSAGTN